VKKVLAGLILTVSLSFASTITYINASAQESGGNPISAQALFVTNNGQLVITLTNLQSGSTTVAQNISDLEFIVSTGLAGTTTLVSSGQEIDCSTTSSCVVGGFASTGWGLGTVGGESILCIICGNASMTITHSGQPSHTILGPNAVDQGSIATGSHNPFINQTATFTLSNSSILASSTITGVVFSFGTTAGDDVGGCVVGASCGGGPGGGQTPEPVSMLLMGAGLVGLGTIRKFRRSC
jgi:hypothetical protein